MSKRSPCTIVVVDRVVQISIDDERSTTYTLRLDRANLDAFIAALAECLALPWGDTSVVRGQDTLQVHNPGPDRTHYIRIWNQRPAGDPHDGGLIWPPIWDAERLVEELIGLRDSEAQ